MTDQEMLELAAKAAGIRVKWEEAHSCYWIEPDQGFKIEPWVPFDDDGQALRLAVKINQVRLYVYEDEVSMAPSEFGIIEPCNGDPYAATRRAFVRVAAEIGKAMP